jgi:hypothetical protein
MKAGTGEKTKAVKNFRIAEVKDFVYHIPIKK